MGFKSENKHFKTCCRIRVEHIESSSIVVVLLLFNIPTRFLQHILERFFWQKELDLK